MIVMITKMFLFLIQMFVIIHNEVSNNTNINTNKTQILQMFLFHIQNVCINGAMFAMNTKDGCVFHFLINPK